MSYPYDMVCPRYVYKLYLHVQKIEHILCSITGQMIPVTRTECPRPTTNGEILWARKSVFQ